MMRLESVTSASAASGAASTSASAMAMSSASLSASSDFMGNQLASYFSQLFEKSPQDLNSSKERHKAKKAKKSKLAKEKRKMEPLADMMLYHPLSLPQVCIPRNPSPFAVFAAIRNTCLENKRKQDTLLQIQSAAAWKEVEDCGNLEATDDSSSSDEKSKKINLPKIVSIGLQGVFELIRESQGQYPSITRKALESLADILGGLQPEELSNEPASIVEPMFHILLDLSMVEDEDIRSLASACVLSLAVAFGDTGKTLTASSAMLMSQPPRSGHDSIRVPQILVSLQRSVMSVMLGRLEHPDFMSHGLSTASRLDSFPVKWKRPSHRPLLAHCITSDGTYLYLQSSHGLFKVGSGYGGTIKGHVYLANADFYAKPGWLGFASGSLFFKATVGEFSKIDTEDLSISSITTETTSSLLSSSSTSGGANNVLFTDGVNIGVVGIDANDKFIIRFLSATNLSSIEAELPLKLAQKSVEVFGSSMIEDNGRTKHQVDFVSEDDTIALQSGKGFALLLTSQGRVYFTGKSATLGQKQPCPNGQWNELAITKSPKIMQIAVGHEGLFGLLLAEDGAVYFAGTARRGEDGDQKNARKPAKPSKPKLLSRLTGLIASQVAANSGTSAVVTKTGDLYLFGKDSRQCDWSGQVIGLKGQTVTQVALGKAHIVALTKEGQVYTFGMNIKGQCGRGISAPARELAMLSATTSNFLASGASAAASGGASGVVDHQVVGNDELNSDDHDIDPEEPVGGLICPNGKHKWKHDQCMVCAVCGECTGYGSHCVSSGRPDRNPGMLCGCGSGDSGCAECGCCRTCAGEEAALASEKARLRDRLIRMEYLAAEANNDDKLHHQHQQQQQHPEESEKFIRKRIDKLDKCRQKCRREKREGRRESELLKALESSMNKERNAIASNQQPSSSDELRDSILVVSLPPAKLALGHKVVQIAAGLYHTLLLTNDGQVYTCGSNNYGQLGLLDLNPRGVPTLVKLPSGAKIESIACGSNHSVLLATDGRVFTFGNYQKGQLGRDGPNDADSLMPSSSREDLALKKLWFAVPGQMQCIGSEYGRAATWIGASGDQTFVRVDETLINAKSLMGSTMMANKHHIVLLPTAQQSINFKSLAISRHDGYCRSFNGPEQATFDGMTVNLDPMHNIVWAYNNKSGCFHSYQPLSINNSSKANIKESILSPELALPLTTNAKTLVSRNQASLNLLSCLDTLTNCPEVSLASAVDEDKSGISGGVAKSFSKEDFTAVNRFDNHGGGWGYSGHSIEAIRFMADTDVLLGGFGLFGGRGEYVGKIKLFDIGAEGGDQEGDGELLAESDEIAYECGARQKFAILFDEAIPIHAGRWYVAWARVSGPSSDCGSSGQAQVTTDDQIQFMFKSSKKSNNGTDVNAGQLPQLLYKLITSEGSKVNRRSDPVLEPICILSSRFARRVTPDCFQSLLGLIKWSWNALKAGLCELLECSDEASTQPVMCDLQRLIYVARACMRLIVTFTEEVYPARIGIGNNQPNKPIAESQSLAECIYDCRGLLQQILTDGLTVLKHNKMSHFGQQQWYKTAMGLAKLVLADAHRSFVACFHAFYPTGYLKWACLCNLLASMEANSSSSEANLNYDRLLTAVLDSLCNPMIKLRNTFPITYSPEAETRCRNFSPTENLSITTSMIQAGDSSSHQFPMLNELMNFRSHMDGIRFASWTFREVLDRLLSIAASPVKSSLKGEKTCVYSKDLVEKSCLVVSSVISELANQTINTDADLSCLGGRILHTTPNRFTRTSNNRTWNTGNGSPDAICFSVDRAGVFIVGCSVYGGTGTYEYELELLDDQSSGLSEKGDHTLQQRWTSQEISHGTYSSDDCSSDIAELKFDRAVPVKPHVKYALRLRNHGGRTSNGDGGVGTVKGPDGTMFAFTSCSLSFNGTNPTRGQLPQILYFSSPQDNDVQAATKSLAEMYARRTALSMTSAIVKVVTGLLIQARDCVEDEKGFEVLNSAPIITKLMPHILASISSLATSDPQSSVQVLSFIQEILPSVASLQNLYALNVSSSQSMEEGNIEASDKVNNEASVKVNNEASVKVTNEVSEEGVSVKMDEAMKAQGKHNGTEEATVKCNGTAEATVKFNGTAEATVNLEATTQHYAWVESDHPYKPASITSQRVLFPSSVHWMSVEFDPQCSTLQAEDVLQIYIRNRNGEKDTSSAANASSPTATTSVSGEMNMQKYTPVLKKFFGTENWPRQNVILPGNEVLFTLGTASNYFKDDRKTCNYGFKCLVVGYEGFSTKNEGLKSLEMELAYLGGTCAASLMKKSMPLLASNNADNVEKEDMEVIEDSALEAYEMHSALIDKGFALDRAPNVHQALDGIIPYSFNSNERLFLRNFVNCVNGTSGGRLARWLQPESFVDVDQCQVLFNSEELKCNWPTIITIITHDQYGDIVQVPDLKVEVNAVPIEEINQSVTRLRKMTAPDAMTFGGHRPPSLEPKYEVTVKDKMLYHAITVQPAYENYSFEELRYASPALQRQSETMLVRPNKDGTYSANWTPGNVGFYQIHVLVDGCEMPEPYKVEVRDPPQGIAPPGQGGPVTKKPQDHQGLNRLRKFIAKPSAGLRVRIHPTLQSEQIGVVSVEGTISIVDEYHNADGIWVRLGQDSLLEYCSPNVAEGWCLQYNQHLEKTLLVPIAETKPQADTCPPPTSSMPFATSSMVSNAEPLLKPPEGSADWKAKRPKGPGIYTVVKCGASGHNIRSSPNLLAPPIGMLALGDVVKVLRSKEVSGEVWVQLDSTAAQAHSFNNDDGDAWSLAYSNSDILYLEPSLKMSDSSRSRSLSRPIGVRHAELAQKPVPPPRHSIALPTTAASLRPAAPLVGEAASSGRSPSPGDARKPNFFQKWFKGEAIKVRAGSQSPPTPRKVTSSLASINKDIPPELIGVSVKELVKVIGESRANGNGVTPPGTPATPRRSVSRSASPQVSSSRGSSPSSVRLTTAQRAASPLLSSHEAAMTRQDSCSQSSSENNTSNLVSSLTRDPSQSPGSASPSLSLKSDPLRSLTCDSSPLRSSDIPTSKSSTITNMKNEIDSSIKRKASAKAKQDIRAKMEANRRGQPVKEAMSPTVAESIRSVFAAFVWHEGIVHDAMAVASYLKFHPDLSKYGSDHENKSSNEEGSKMTRQRHSMVEVATPPYLNANSLEDHEASGQNANKNRKHKHGHLEGLRLASDLPPTIRLLVMLWDEIKSYCIQAILQQMIVASPLAASNGLSASMTKSGGGNHAKRDSSRSSSGKTRKRKSREEQQPYYDPNKEAEATAAAVAGKVLEEAFHQLCEMCGHYFQHPVTYHMRVAHPGCGGHAGSKGYNSGGHYCGGWAGNCGDGGAGGSSWYLICEKCRASHMSNKPHASEDAKNRANQMQVKPPPLPHIQQPSLRKKSNAGFNVAAASTTSASQINSHIIMTNNAMFLLDLASSAEESGMPSSASKMMSSASMTTSIGGLSAVSELGSMDPNPFPLVPFQCFNKLGIRDSHLRLINDELILDDLTASNTSSQPQMLASKKDITPPEGFQNTFGPPKASSGFSRSASVGHNFNQEEEKEVAAASLYSRKRNNSSCSGEHLPPPHGADFLSNPSKALQKLFDRNVTAVSDILQRPVISFVLQWNDLESLQIAMTQALRKAACRTYALQALNWLLRSVSQPACLHDLLWCFVSALEANTTESSGGGGGANSWSNMNDPEKKAKKGVLKKARKAEPGVEGLFDHPTEDISIAGEAIQPLPSTFHGLLQTVSDLMLLLPVGSSLQQIAITCWCIKFRPQDHHFLHQSHVFSTISKILSRSEEFESNSGALANAASSVGVLHEELETAVEGLVDVTASLELKVSSRVAMLASLTDNSTETFWESGDEDRNKSKWVTASIKASDVKVKSISVHVDNGRDIGNKVLHLVFKGGSNPEDLLVLKQYEVEKRFAGWVTCFVDTPDDALTHLRIEAKGPDNTLRLRQVKALGFMDAAVPLVQKQPLALSIQQRNCEAETLRVFRLITSQVFGRLLENEQTGSSDEPAETTVEDTEGNQSSLKEHVVGILFSRASKLTHLQKQVCSHIVSAIKKEAGRMREAWEMSLCSSGEATPEATPDTYCFEMMSLVLALSGSGVGRSHLASQYAFIKDLLSLLHTSSGRIQRQVIALLRRVLPEVKPETFAGLMGIAQLPPKDFGVLARSTSEIITPNDIGIVDVFLSCISKALTLQVKSKVNKEAGGPTKTHLMTVNLATSIHPRDPTGPRWWLRGSMTKKIAEEIIHLLKDMTSSNLGPEWADLTKSAVAEAILNLTRLDESHRDPSECLKYPVLWLALASLCVLDKDHVDGLSSGEWNNGEAAASRPACDNHDDGETLAIILCDQCGNLCGDCDRFLHLHRRTKAHQRQVFKEEEDAIKVDLHEGCGRTKLFWLMALADSLTLKAMVEFRDGGRQTIKLASVLAPGSSSSEASNFLTCRFCMRQSSPEHPVMDSLCPDKECVALSRLACTKVLTCGHFCGGIAEEANCLPCLHGCSGGASGLRQDADDMCMICFTEALWPIPSIQLKCGHVFHFQCCQKILEKRWTGPRITFGFCNCPICKARLDHEALQPLLDPIDGLYNDVRKKALMRLEYEGLTKSEAVTAKGARFHNDPTGFALERYAYYVCFKCGKAYFGGEAQCDDVGGQDDYNPEELVCGGCSDVSRAQMCPKHGTDYLEYKCRYCCSVAVFFCFGTTHFCNACHEDFQRVANVPKPDLPQCPVGPKSVQLDGEECPLHVSHPPTGEEYALGCGVCRNAHTF